MNANTTPIINPMAPHLPHTVAPDLDAQTAFMEMVRNKTDFLAVVSPSRHLQGLVTEGDFKRHLWKHGTLSLPLSQLLNPNPRKLSVSGDTARTVEDAQNLIYWARLRKISPAKRAFPVVDQEGIFKGVVSITDIETFIGHHLPRFFTTSDNQRLHLQPGLRTQLKPGWKSMLDINYDKLPQPSDLSPSLVENNLNAARQVKKKLDINGFDLSGKRLMEIGCYDGAWAYALSHVFQAPVTAIDIPAYYIYQAPNRELNHQNVEKQRKWLATLQELTAQKFQQAGIPTQNVTFYEEDITHLTHHKDARFDALFSREVLEHVKEPVNAFQNMFRLLNTGGICFHEYNPFFSINGGHSLCTLDIPYGHARLTPQDFQRYIETFHPRETTEAMAFYNENLNRMSLADLEKFARQANFKIPLLLTYPQNQYLQFIDDDALSQVKKIYPTVTLQDLLCPLVRVIMQR